jgi:UDP-glucose 4-epimerase
MSEVGDRAAPLVDDTGETGVSARGRDADATSDSRQLQLPRPGPTISVVSAQASGIGPRTHALGTEHRFARLEPGAPCLVVGGGLVGSHVAVALASAGHPTTVFSRTFSPWLIEQLSRCEQIRLIAGELPTDETLLAHVDEAEAVFLLAGFSTPALSEGDATASSLGSLVPSLSVFDAMRRTSTRRVLLASSGGTVYGKVQILPTPEIHVRQPISVHGVNAVVLEEYAMFFAREHGLYPTILRLSNVYGPAQYARGGQGVIAAWCRAIVRGEPVALIGDGSVRRDFVFARDAAEAIVAAARDADPGTYNIGSGTATPLSELLDLLGAISGRAVEIQRLPPRRVDVPVTMLDGTELATATGWRPATPLVRGLSLTWDWFQDHTFDEPQNHGVSAPGGAHAGNSSASAAAPIAGSGLKHDRRR